MHFSFSPAAAEVLKQETSKTIDAEQFVAPQLVPSELARNLQYHHYRDFFAGIASGSFLTGGMAICPCSMGTIGESPAGFRTT